jgi:hypothetical protein
MQDIVTQNGEAGGDKSAIFQGLCYGFDRESDMFLFPGHERVSNLTLARLSDNDALFMFVRRF